jgi:hypothetical protein
MLIAADEAGMAQQVIIQAALSHGELQTREQLILALLDDG